MSRTQCIAIGEAPTRNPFDHELFTLPLSHCAPNYPFITQFTYNTVNTYGPQQSIIKGLHYSYYITKPTPIHYCIMGVRGVEVLEVLCALVHGSPVDM